MSFHYNIFSITLLMTGVAALFVSILIFRWLGGAVKWFSAMIFCSAIWATCYALELASYTLDQMLFWINLEYIGISFLPAAWIFFIIRFIGKEEWLTLKNSFLIIVFPSITLLLVWTNQWHHLHYEEASLATDGPFPLLAIKPGVWYRVHTVYFYFLLAWGLYLLVNKFRKADSIYKKQNAAILIGAFIPWTINLIYLLGIRPYNHIDLTPYAFILTCIVLSFGLLRFKLFDIVPLAREQIIEDMREGVFVLDNHMRVIDLNPTMKKILIHNLTDLIGKNLWEIFPAETMLVKLVADKVNDKIDMKLDTDSGERFFEVSITSLFNKKLRYTGAIFTFRDITERKEVEEKLKQQATELLALNQLKDQLFSIISHDLRSPLASLIDILNLAGDGELSDEEFKTIIPELSKNVGHTSVLLENLLYWSKSQLKGEVILPEKFDLKALAEDKLLFFEKKASEKSIRIQDQIKRNTIMLADKNMVQVVLQNLISNAIKFCRNNDIISLTAQTDSITTTVCVGDTGIGMSKETLDKLFGTEILTTLGTHQEKGTGLGLKLCKDFIEKNNGRIWAESAEGKGSKFYFSLRSK